MNRMERMISQDGCVLTCMKTDCSYNQQEECLAPDIQVGETHPMCDTYTTMGMVDKADKDAMVRQCGVSQCDFNDDMDCKARGITVGDHTGHADCFTYRG